MYCGRCQGFVSNQINPNQGVCRGAPPTAIAIGITQDPLGRPVVQTQAYFPAPIGADIWCLGFRPRRADPEPLPLRMPVLDELFVPPVVGEAEQVPAVGEGAEYMGVKAG
jgi:hypothetical protein